MQAPPEEEGDQVKGTHAAAASSAVKAGGRCEGGIILVSVLVLLVWMFV